LDNNSNPEELDLVNLKIIKTCRKIKSVQKEMWRGEWFCGVVIVVF